MKPAVRMLSAVLAAMLPPVLATASDAVPVGAPFLNSTLSVRQMGMGDLSLAGSDVLRGWCNPAVLSGQATRGEAGFSGSSMFRGVQETFGLGVGWRVSSDLAVGGLVSAYSAGFPEVNGNGDSGVELTQQSVAGGPVVAWRQDWISVGATVKYVSETGGEQEAEGMSTVAADLGLVADWREWSFGLAVRNVGGWLRKKDAITPAGVTLPAQQRAGIACRVPGMPLSGGVEYVNGGAGNPGGASAGAEWWPFGRVALRAGGAGIGGTTMRLTFGLSAMYRGISVDYAFGTHPLGLTHRFGITAGFGPAVAPAAETP